jgi:phosphatidate cytidylyltransferase
MAFNWQTFRTRALTAILFVVLMLLGLLWNQWSFLVLFSIIHFGCWWEYLKLIEKIHNVKFHPYVKLGLMVLGYGLMLRFCGPEYQINGYALRENISFPVSMAGFVLLIFGIFQKTKVHLQSFVAGGIGILYISVCWGLFIALDPISNSSPSPFSLPIFLILTMWINDTMAYIVGSLIGKTPLSKISPKKTWEGTIGGIILAVIVMGLLAAEFMPDRNKNEWFIIAAIAAIAGTFGDLLESKLKRMAQVKDSGQIMPGHGGFLDRFDSLLLAVPAIWFCMICMLMLAGI